MTSVAFFWIDPNGRLNKQVCETFDEVADFAYNNAGLAFRMEVLG